MIEPAGARFAVPLVAVLAVSVLVSLLEGVPQQLPGVALGSDVLLHIERVSAIFAIVVAVLSVLHEATAGRLPTQLTTSGLAYEAGGQAARATEKLQRQFDDLYTQVQDLVNSPLPTRTHRGRVGQPWRSLRRRTTVAPRFWPRSALQTSG